MSNNNMGQNLNKLMEEAQKMQKKMQDAQSQLLKLEVIGESGGGKVKVYMNGSHKVKDLFIDPSLSDDMDMIEPLLISAWNDAVNKVEKVSQEKINQLTSGLKLPPDFMGAEEEEK